MFWATKLKKVFFENGKSALLTNKGMEAAFPNQQIGHLACDIRKQVVELPTIGFQKSTL